jgi:RNA polymerase sigma-70 factor (ECF subfamily)
MPRNSVSEHALIERLQRGDSSAVAVLASAYGPRIHQLAFRYMKNREDAEEVAQDVLMKVHRKIHAFRGDSALSSWIYRITFNAAMSRLRNASFARSSELPEETLRSEQSGERTSRWLQAADWSSLADDAYLRTQMRERLRHALRALPAIYRVPVELRDLEGLSTEEASRVLRVKTQTLKSRLHRGRLILRERLVDFAGGLSLHPAA